jgi:hypothetical protein
VIRLSKLEAARRQLETAIKLYFKNGDEASIHTLAAAAYSVIRDINKRRGGTPMFKDLDFVKGKAFVRAALKYINRPDNFLKHGAKDTDEELELEPKWAEVLIWEASQKYCEMTGEQNKLMLTFVFWFVVHHAGARERVQKELLSQGFREQYVKRVLSLPLTDRQRFFKGA